jgi:hypothetical protein
MFIWGDNMYHFKEITTNIKKVVYVNNKLLYESEILRKDYYYKKLENGKLGVSISNNPENLEKNVKYIPFKGKELPIIPDKEIIQVNDCEELEPIDINYNARQEIYYIEKEILHKDYLGNILVKRYSHYKYCMRLYYNDLQILIEDSDYSIRDLRKRIENKLNYIVTEEVKVSEKTPVCIFDSAFYAYLITAAYGNLVKTKKSFLISKNLENLTIIEDPLLKKPYKYFDDDGIKTSKKIVLDSELKTSLFDFYYGIEFEEKSTGNGFYGLNPNGIGYSYLIYEGKNKVNLEELDRVILAFNCLGWHTCDWSSGFINVSLSYGVYVEKGEIKGYVKGYNIIGQLSNLLKDNYVLKTKEENQNIVFEPIIIK